MRPSPWSSQAEAALDQPITLTERQFDSLERRGATAIAGTVLAALGIILVLLGVYRVETTLRRSTAEVAVLRATLADSVRAQVASLMDQAAREEIQQAARAGAAVTLSAAQADVARLTRRVGALSARLESERVALAAQSARIGAVEGVQTTLEGRLALSDARIASLDSTGAAQDAGLRSETADLGQRLATVENIQRVQDEDLRATDKKQSIMLGVVPLIIGPYIHMLDHGGR